MENDSNRKNRIVFFISFLMNEIHDLFRKALVVVLIIELLILMRKVAQF